MLVAWPESPNKDEVQAWRLIPVIEQAIETAALMLGSDRPEATVWRICADFLAGANLDHGYPEMLLFSMTRFFKFLPEEQRQQFLSRLEQKAS